MNDLELIKSQLNEINNKRVKYQTLKEQALKQIESIQEKYNIKSIDELKALMDEAQLKYEQSIKEAERYIEEANSIFTKYQGVI